MDHDYLSNLPDELLGHIVYHLSPKDTVAFGTVSKRCDKITHEALVWRRHCIEGWRYWDSLHDLPGRTLLPPAQTRWRDLFEKRKKMDDDALAKFNVMLLAQQYRTRRIEQLTTKGYDILDLMVNLERNTPDDAEDVLARRYHARIIRAKLYRQMAINQWDRINDSRMVSLDSALGAYDLFALSGEAGNLIDLQSELQRLASAVEKHIPNFKDLCTRQKAIEVATYLRSEHLLGNDQLGGYHALRNNYITLALMREPHRSLPLQSAAIYCGVARRLGVDARPSNFPHHVYVVVQPPRGKDLEGRAKMSTPLDFLENEYMYMDPWRSDQEVDRSHLVTTLNQMGTTPANHDAFLGPASLADTVLRAGRNIVNSVTETRNRLRVAPQATSQQDDIDVERAWYSMLWATMLIGYGDHHMTLQRQRSCLPYLLEHYQMHFPEDLGLLERYILPMFRDAQEHDTLLHLVGVARAGDENMKAPSPRGPHTSQVEYKVGNHFKHRRYGYTGVIIGWDTRCEAQEQWITQMRVNELPNGRHQPFYHVL